MSQGRVEETPKIFGSLTLNTSSEKLNSIDRLQNSISNSTLLSLYGDLDNQCRDKMNNDKVCHGGQLTTSTNNILIRNTGFCVFRMKKIRSCSTWTRDSDDYFLNMPISVNNETLFQVELHLTFTLSQFSCCWVLLNGVNLIDEKTTGNF